MNGNRRLTLLSVLVMLVGLLVISFMVKDRIIDKDKKSMQSGMTEDKDTENKDDVMENQCMCGEDGQCIADGICRKGCTCGTSDSNRAEMTIEEAADKFNELKAQETAILSENNALWEKVFLAMNKDNAMTMIEDGKNYGDYLLDTIAGIKDQFTAGELKLLQEAAERIRGLEAELTMLEEKYPEAAQLAMGSNMNQSPDDSVSVPADAGNMQQFPAFEGKDLDGNNVRSDEFFSGNAVTVVNFWFTTCGPCVGELAELDALNRELMEKGGALIGVNAFTLDGSEADISEAKDVLMKKGATYQNVYFDSGSEAGRFVGNIYAYPTTYVVDRSGNIVGDPIVGAITSKAQMEALKLLIDKTIAADMG